MKKCLLILLVCFGLTINAQQTTIYTHENLQFSKAISLFESKQYLAAQDIFKSVSTDTKNQITAADCAYYISNCAIHLNQKGAEELVTNFIENYPTSSKNNAANHNVANYYYANNKYSYALKWYEKVETQSLNNKEKENYNFRKGYSLFNSNQKDKAKKYFDLVSDSEIYGSQAKYYLGYIAYQGDEYKEATAYFEQVNDQKKYQEKMAYFQADMNFKLGKFEKAIDLGSQQLPLSSDPEERSQLNKIVGESFFNLKKYEKSLPYLKDYEGQKGKWSNTDHYQLGYVYFMRKEFEAAISEFNKIIDGKNSVAQNGYYHLAKCYLETDKKQEALNAFKNASEMNFNSDIKEDAALNYAKLSYEIGNPYQTTPEVLITYLKTYPKSDEKENIEQLLIDSYITSKNYKEALVLLEGKTGFEYRVAYQKVAYFRGTTLYNEGLFSEAKVLFEKAIKEPKTKRYTAKSQYWSSECDYLLGNFQDAVIGYKLFALETDLTTYPEAEFLDYQLAYGYFKQKKYNEAIPFFKSFIEKNTSDKLRINDTYLRLADSYFVTLDYWSAMENYNIAKQLNGLDADYAHFQKAVSYGFIGKNKEKAADLNLFLNDFPDSKYRDDAYFELGNTYVLLNNTVQAQATYTLLTQQYPKSSYISKTLLKQALIYFNEDKNEQALNKFKQVVRDFPGSSEANQAVATSRIIYVDLDRVNEYVTWVKDLDFIEVTDADLDNTTYEAAEKQYLNNNTNQAISGFTNYLQKFENGLHANQSHFYVAQLYFKKGEKEATIPHYKKVISKERNEFTEQALARLSQVYLELKDWNNARTVLLRLEIEADFPQNIIFSQSNLMKSNYELEDYTNAVNYAEKVLLNPKIEDAIKSDAQVVIARSAIKTNYEEKAKIAYAEVQKIATGSLAAEALYYDAYFTSKEENYAASNIKIQQLTRDYSGYKYFAAKSLVLMATNFYELNDSFQATYILERVLENFATYEDVKEEAAKKLKHIKSEEAKRNSSIQIEENDETPLEKED